MDQEWLHEICHPIWQRLPASLRHIVVDSLIPFSGFAVILFSQNRATPLIIEKEKKGTVNDTAIAQSFVIVHDPDLQASLLPTESLNGLDLRTFTQQFRQHHAVPLALGFDLDYLTTWHQQQAMIWELLALYGEKWTISAQMEWDDLVLSLPKMIRYFAAQKDYQECGWDRQHFFALLQTYLENFIQNIRSQSIFLQCQQQERKNTYEITMQGIYEVETNRNIPTDRLFIFDLDMLNTFWPWLSDTSLRLFVRFVDAILPAEISETVERQECLMYLLAKDERNKRRDLLIWGSQQHLPNRQWRGDCYAMLMQPSSRKIIWQEYLPISPITIQQEAQAHQEPPTQPYHNIQGQSFGNQKTPSSSIKDNHSSELSLSWENSQQRIQIRIPHDSQMHSLLLSFQSRRNMDWKQGCSKFISSTSILAPLVPGVRNLTHFGELHEPSKVTIAEKSYQIIAGSLCYIQSQGRIFKRQGLVHHLRHWWTTLGEAGLYCAATCHPHFYSPDWWQSLVADTESGGIVIRANEHHTFTPAETLLPQWQNLQSLDWIKSRGKVGFSTYAKLRFWLGNAWVMPYDYQGNCLIRGPALMTVGQQIGIAMLEFPCRIWGEELLQPMHVELREWHGQLQFCTPTCKLLTLQHAQYLRRFRPGPSWTWRYMLNHIGKEQELPDNSDQDFD